MAKVWVLRQIMGSKKQLANRFWPAFIKTGQKLPGLFLNNIDFFEPSARFSAISLFWLCGEGGRALWRGTGEGMG
ncbi:MAG: hypothetical protein ACO1OQ_05115 [Rufibacter sp.]